MPPIVLAALCALAVSAWAPRAHAYAWMVRHAYAQCAPCHADPSGGGPVTAYGRAVADEVLRMRLPGEDAEAGGSARSAGFLFGAVALPESLMLGAHLRYLHLRQKIEGAPVMARSFLMQADFEAAIALDRLAGAVSVGYADEGALGASLTRAPENNLVSRFHWLGYWLGESSVLVRAGRMNLPFGLRIVEHTSWVRALTRSSVNDDQQYGAALAYQGTPFAERPLRAELMAVAGNFQIRPDEFRERGYSGLVEWFPMDALGVGASSLVTHRQLDPRSLRETWRHAHGVFARWATGFQPLVLMTEWTYALESPKYAQRREGVIGFVQADLEPAQGIHLIGTGELHTVGVDGPPASYGAWLSYAWFFLPHADLRVDSVYQRVGTPVGHVEALALLLQGHLHL